MSFIELRHSAKGIIMKILKSPNRKLILFNEFYLYYFLTVLTRWYKYLIISVVKFTTFIDERQILNL